MELRHPGKFVIQTKNVTVLAPELNIPAAPHRLWQLCVLETPTIKAVTSRLFLSHLNQSSKSAIRYLSLKVRVSLATLSISQKVF